MEKKQPKEFDEKDDPAPQCCSQRWILAYIGFLGFGVVYSLRVNISVGIVCMVKNTDDVIDTSFWNSTSTMPTYTDPSLETCAEETKAASHSNDRAELDWDSTTKSAVLASFFYGYIVSQVPGGLLADRYGGKRVLLIVLALSSLLTLLMPICARTSVYLVYAIRITLGLLTAMTFPAMHAMWGRWAPPLERSKLTTFCYAGTTLGNVVTFSTSGLLCEYGFDNGWGSIFYVTGGLGIIWSCAWFYLAADTPRKHPRITTQEAEFIINSLEYDTSKKTTNVPWLAIAKAPCLWACLTAHVCNNWTNYTLLTNIPTFMKDVLKFDIKSNGALSSIPYICQFVSALLAGQLADFIRSKRWLSTTATRKVFQTFAFTGAGACLVGVGFCTCENRAPAVALLSSAVMFMGFGRAGYVVNHVDFAPKYAGVMFGITNTVATIPGMTAPLFAGYLTPNHTQEEWRTVFYVCAGFAAFGMIIFNLFASGEQQEWARDAPVEVEIGISADDGKDSKVAALDKYSNNALPDNKNNLILHDILDNSKDEHDGSTAHTDVELDIQTSGGIVNTAHDGHASECSTSVKM